MTTFPITQHHANCRCQDRHGTSLERPDTFAIPEPTDDRTPRRGNLIDPCAILAATLDASSISSVLANLGVTRDPKTTRQLRTMCAAYGIPLPVRPGRPTTKSKLTNRDQVARAAARSNNTRQAVTSLGLASCGTTNRRFEQACRGFGIELPWKGRGTVAQLNALSPAVIERAMAGNRSNGAALDQLGIRKDGNAYAWMKQFRAETVTSTTVAQ